jgi:hypothetical protein
VARNQQDSLSPALGTGEVVQRHLRRLLAEVAICLVGVGLLQLAVHALLPSRLAPGVVLVVAMAGNLLVASGLSAALHSMLRLVAPVKAREAAIAAATIGVFYSSVVGALVGIDIVAAPTLAEDAVGVIALGSVLAVGLVLAKPIARARGMKHLAEDDQGPGDAGGCRLAG